MKNFFLNHNNYINIEIFSFYHIIMILLTLLVVFYIIVNKEKFINFNDKKKKRIRYILAIILIINFILRRGSFIYYGVYDWHYHLDINFCNFTSIMFFLYAITGNRKIYNICYYMAFIGPLLAILFPSVTLMPLTYSFYSFLILHHLIFIFNIIFIYTENLHYNKKDFFNTSVFLIIYFVTIYIFNYIFNTNYNMPLTFVNNVILNNKIINILAVSNVTIFIIFIVIIIMLLMISKIILKFFKR